MNEEKMVCVVCDKAIDANAEDWTEIDDGVRGGHKVHFECFDRQYAADKEKAE